MERIEFLREVLCSEGTYFLFYIDNKSPRQQAFADLDELNEAVDRLLAANPNRDMYVAMSSFADPEGGRKQVNVRARKTLSLDLDVDKDATDDKHFTSKKQALLEMSRFAKELGLPDAAVVDSGRGIHVHWILDRELPPDEWKSLADALKDRAVALNFNMDPAVPGDSARVFRLPDTTNTRNGAKARVLKSAAPCSPDTLRKLLGAKPVAIAQPPAQRSTALLDAMKVTNSYPPGKSEVIERKCAQVSWAVANQDKVPEPFWYALMGIAAFCDNPSATAVRWSDQHPDFNADATIKKMEQYSKAATGPATCETFRKLRPSGCQGCPYKVITSPIMLGAAYEEAKKDDLPELQHIVDLPAPYKRVHLGHPHNRNGIVEEVEGVDIPVSNYDLYPISYGRDESAGTEIVRFTYKRPNFGWYDVSLGHEYLSPSLTKEFARLVGQQGITLPTIPQEQKFHAMTRAYMDALKERTRLVNIYSTMGWKDNGSGFVLGKNHWQRMEDGTVSHTAHNLSTSSTSFADRYTTAGTLDGWIDGTELLQHYKLNLVKFGILVALSGPLYTYAGLRGIMFSLFGPTATGKTLTLRAAQSVYGDPHKLVSSSDMTANNVNSLMAMSNSTLVALDEATVMRNSRIGDLAYAIELGQERGRLNRNGSMKEQRTWYQPVLVSSNKSMTEAINSGTIGNAQLARMFEIEAPMPEALSKDLSIGTAVGDALIDNHGQVALKWLPYLVAQTPDEWTNMLRNNRNHFSKTYGVNFTSEERFWDSGLNLADLAGQLADNQKLIKFDHEEAIHAILKSIGVNRQYISGAKLTAPEIIAEFLSDKLRNMVVAIYNSPNDPKPVTYYNKYDNIYARMNLMRSSTNDQNKFDSGTVYIDKRALKTWCQTNGHSVHQLVEELKLNLLYATPASGKAMLGKDTELRLGQCYVVGVSLNNPVFAGLLTNEEQYEQAETSEAASAEDREALQAAMEDR